jgi:hypothetical protein
MASNAPGRCCIVGFKHEGDPQGTVKRVGDSVSVMHRFQTKHLADMG